MIKYFIDTLACVQSRLVYMTTETGIVWAQLMMVVGVTEIVANRFYDSSPVSSRDSGYKEEAKTVINKC